MSILSKKELEFEPGIPLSVKFLNIKSSKPTYHETSLRFVYVMDGKLSVFHDYRTYELTRDEFLMIDNDTPYFFDSDEDNLTILLDLNLKNELYDWDEIKNYYWFCNSKTPWEFMITADSLRRIKNHIVADAGYFYYAKDAFREMSLHMCADIMELLNEDFRWFKRVDIPNEDAKKYVDRFQHILSYVIGHYEEKIQLSDVAERIHVDASYLSHMINLTPYRSFKKMLNAVRCEWAEDFLLTTDMSISEISSACGFSSEDYFRKQFSEILYTTPSNFRSLFKSRAARKEDIKQVKKQEIAPFLARCVFDQFASSVFPYADALENSYAAESFAKDFSDLTEVVKADKEDAARYNILTNSEK